MKYIFSFIVVNIFIFNLYAVDKIEGKMGVLTDGLVDAIHKDYSIAFDILIHRISDEMDVCGHLQYYDSEKKILKDFLENNLDYIVINPIYYLKNQKKLDMDILSYWSIRKYKTKFQKMLIIVRKDSGINTVADLKDKTVMLKNDNYMGKMSLNKAILESKHISSDIYVKDFHFVARDSTAVLKTFFSKVDAAVVPESAFDIVSDMNPAVKKSLKIIYKTDNIFMPMLSIINKNISPKLMKRLKKVLENFHQNVDGKNILTLFKMNRLDILESKELDNLRKYYADYIYLQKKYGLTK